MLSVLARLPLNTQHRPAELALAARHAMRDKTTAVLITPRSGAEAVVDEASRGSMLVISSASPEADQWFRFDPAVDFGTAMPAEQQPKMNGGTQARRHEGTKESGRSPLRASVP
jgi:hypothetical protein